MNPGCSCGIARSCSTATPEAANYVTSERQRNRKALNACLSELRESMESDVLPAFKPVCQLLKGSHRDGIIKVATEIEADLVVVGDLAHSRVTHLIVDSTAERPLSGNRAARCG